MLLLAGTIGFERGAVAEKTLIAMEEEEAAAAVALCGEEELDAFSRLTGALTKRSERGGGEGPCSDAEGDAEELEPVVRAGVGR